MYKEASGKIVATIEARMTSSRLPGKVLLPLGGKPVLQLLVERVQRSAYIDAICIATTVNPADDPIEALAQKLGVHCFRGSEEDVLGRVLGAAESVGAEVIVELVGDSPCVDPALVDHAIEEFYRTGADYACNMKVNEAYASGFEVQVFPTKVLAEVATLTQDPVDRTHVSYYIYTHRDRYTCHIWEDTEDVVGPFVHVALDEKADYQVLCALADGLFPEKPYFTAQDVTTFLREHPEIAAYNAGVRQKQPHEL